VKEKLPLSKAAGSASQEKPQIFKARARALAQELGKPAESGNYLEILEFSLAYERYGLETSFVREVYPLKELTPLPCTPPFVLGIINVRGQILAVIDLKRLFNLPSRGLSDLNKVIILRRGRLEVGLLVDAVTGVRSVPLPELQTSLPTLEGLSPDYLKGITSDALIILDAEKILADPKLIVHEEVELPTQEEKRRRR
jgi:purine-binding chemotaxis protein CheW